MCDRDVMTEIVSLSVREVTLFLAVLAPPPHSTLAAPAALLVTHFTSSQSCDFTGQSARIITALPTKAWAEQLEPRGRRRRAKWIQYRVVIHFEEGQAGVKASHL